MATMGLHITDIELFDFRNHGNHKRAVERRNIAELATISLLPIEKVD